VDWIDQLILNPKDEARITEIRKAVNSYMKKFPLDA
jgi:hypothetical protein